MNSDVKASFGGGKGANTMRVLGSLKESTKSLEASWEKISTHSKNTVQNIKGIGQHLGHGFTSSMNGTYGASSMSGATPPPSFGGFLPQGAPASSTPGFQDNTSSMSFRQRAGRLVLGAGAASAQAVDPSEYIINDIARNRFGFLAGRLKGAVGLPGSADTGMFGSEAFLRMVTRGTATSTMDAANAASSGATMGILPGLKNYNTVSNSVAALSNVVPGAGLEGSMGAVAALNQGSSVNKLRMIGIQVRDRSGYMRGVEEIARDVWNLISKTATGRGKITQEQLSYSLQPGMSLDMLLNQYFNNDPVLREGIVSFLFQFAGSTSTAALQTEEGKKALLATGANPGITQSIGRRNAMGYYLQDVNTGPGILGIQAANDSIAALSKTLGGLIPVAAQLRDAFIFTNTFMQTLGGAANGAGGTLIGSGPSGAMVKSPAIALILGAIAGVSNARAEDYLKRVGNDYYGNPMIPDDVNQQMRDNVRDQLRDQQGGSDPSGVNPGTPSGPGASERTGTKSMPLYKAKSTRFEWSRKLLKRLGAPLTSANVSAIEEWLMHENTSSSGFMGERNNPLNTKYDIGQSVGTDQYGIPVYATEQAGLDAAVATLTNVKGHGYENIVKFLKAGTASEAATFAQIVGSDWAAGNYGAAKGRVSFNGTTVNINLPTGSADDPQAIARAVFEALTDENLVQQAQDTNTMRDSSWGNRG